MGHGTLARAWQRADLIWQREEARIALLGLTLMTLWVAWEIKAICLHHGWDGFQYASICYSEFLPIYHAREIAVGKMPYVDSWIEYPLLTGLWMYGAHQVAEAWMTASPAWDWLLPDRPENTPHAFFIVNVVGLGLLALGVTLLLTLLVRDRRRVVLWAAAPTLAVAAFLNWDILAVFFATLGLWLYQRDRNGWAGAALAVGASAKFYPALFLPLLGLELLARERGLRGRGWRFGLAAVGTMALLHLPFLLFSRDMYLETYRFQFDRLPEWETFYTIGQHYANRNDWGWLRTLTGEDGVTWISRLGLLLPYVGLAVLVVKRRLTALHACFAAVLLFFLVNPVFNMQYVIWIVPFLVLVPMPWAAVALLFLSDVLVHRFKFHMLIHIEQDTARFDEVFDGFAFWTLLRHTVFIWMLALLVRTAWRPALMPAVLTAADPAPPAATEGSTPGIFHMKTRPDVPAAPVPADDRPGDPRPPVARGRGG